MDVGSPGYLLMAVEHGGVRGRRVARGPTTSCHQPMAGAPGGPETTRASVGGVGRRVGLGLERGGRGEVGAESWVSRAWGSQGPLSGGPAEGAAVTSGDVWWVPRVLPRMPKAVASDLDPAAGPVGVVSLSDHGAVVPAESRGERTGDPRRGCASNPPGRNRGEDGSGRASRRPAGHRSKGSL